MKESRLPVQQKQTRTDRQNIFDLTGSENSILHGITPMMNK
jgi:hypothetical protein